MASVWTFHRPFFVQVRQSLQLGAELLSLVEKAGPKHSGLGSTKDFSTAGFGVEAEGKKEGYRAIRLEQERQWTPVGSIEFVR